MSNIYSLDWQRTRKNMTSDERIRYLEEQVKDLENQLDMILIRLTNLEQRGSNGKGT